MAITKYLDLFTYWEKDNDVSVQGTVQSVKWSKGSQRYPSQKRSRPRVIVKLTSSARNRPVLLASGVDCVMAISEIRYTLLAFGSAMPGFIAMFNALIGWSHDIKRLSTTDTDTDGRYHSRYAIRQIQVENFPPRIRAMSWSEAVLECYSCSGGAVTLVGAKMEGPAPIGAVLIPPSENACLDSFECVFAIGDIHFLENRETTHTSNARCTEEPHNARIGRRHDGDMYGNGNDERYDEDEGELKHDEEGGEQVGQGVRSTEDLLILQRGFSASRRRFVPSHLPSNSQRAIKAASTSPRPTSVVTLNSDAATNFRRLPSDSAIDAQKMAGSFYLGTPTHIAPREPSSRGRGVKVLNRFVAADVAGASRRSAGKRFLSASLKEREGSRLSDHILVTITATNTGNMSLNAIMLPLLYFLRCLRSITCDPVVILCDRADELRAWCLRWS